MSRRLTIAQIIEQYQDFAAWAEEYDFSEDSSLADFVSSFGYGEASLADLLSSARISDETRELLSSLDSKLALKALRKHSELRLVGVHYEDGEVFSATIGETEHQPDDELLKAFLKLSLKSREKVSGAVSDAYLNTETGLLYAGDDYQRWVMVLDEEALLEDDSYRLKPKLAVLEGGNPFCSRPSKARLELVS